MRTHRRHLRCLLRKLRPLYAILDELFLFPSLLVVAPPHRPLIIAFQAQVFARFALAFTLVTLLPPEPACEAAYQCLSVDASLPQDCLIGEPERDLLCILVPLVLCSVDFGAAITVALLFCPGLLAALGIPRHFLKLIAD